jgi:phospholipid-translocating ATPase
VDRQEDSIELINPLGILEKFEILENFPFTSESKRMGIIVRHWETRKLIFYVKGADVAMLSKVKPG